MLISCDRQHQQVALGTLEWDRIELIAAHSEPIVRLYVNVGDRVQANQVLVEFRGIASRVDQARLQAITAKLQASQKQLERIQKLRATGAAAQAELDKAVSDVDVLQSQYDELIAVQRNDYANIDNCHSNHKESERIQSLICAPVAGLIEALPFKVGEQPLAGQNVAVILADSLPYARIYAPQTHRSQLSLGQKLSVSLDGNTYQGKIRLLSSDPVFTPYYTLTEEDRSRLSYLVEIELNADNLSTNLAGMPLEVALP